MTTAKVFQQRMAQIEALSLSSGSHEDFEHGMREFAIYDNNGYMLQFGQEIEA